MAGVDKNSVLFQIGTRIDALLQGKIPEPIDAEKYDEEVAEAAAVIVNDLVNSIDEIWKFIIPLAQGKLSVEPPATKNLMASPFKELQARLRQITWQAQRVTEGDYNQRIAFMGEFSEAFNHMVEMLAEREASLKQANADLRNALDELQRKEAMLIAQEKQSALGRLLAQLNHEFNNPLSVVAANLGPIREYLDVYNQLVDKAKEARAVAGDWGASFDALLQELDYEYIRNDAAAMASNVEEATQRLIDINNSFKTFVRGDARTAVAVDLEEGLRATVRMLTKTVHGQVNITVECQSPLPPIRVLPGETNQVFFNLLKNAQDAVGTEGQIRISAAARDRKIVFVFEDSGPGVPVELQDKVFDAFFTTKEIGAGTGLGLAISREIVEKYGGSLSLDTHHIAGARFIMELPLDSGASDDESGT